MNQNLLSLWTDGGQLSLINLLKYKSVDLTQEDHFMMVILKCIAILIFF